MSETAVQFYERRTKESQERIQWLTTRTWWISGARLVVFLLVASLIWQFWGSASIVVPSFLIGALGFVALVRKSAELSAEKKFCQEKVRINQEELGALKGELEVFRTGANYQQADHAFSHDIDLFGKGSFFQYLNRTALQDGETQLANWLVSNDVNDVPAKQKAIQELRDKAEWRQDYTAYAAGVKPEWTTQQTVSFLKNYRTFLPGFIPFLTWGYSISSLLVITLGVFSIIPGIYIFYWTLLGLGITGMYFQKISSLQSTTTQIKSTFAHYTKLLQLIETQSFDSERLKAQAAVIQEGKERASAVLHSFSRALDQLDQRNNLIFAYLGNGFLLWDLIQARRIEIWIKQYGHLAEQWFESVAAFDAWHSLANLAFNQNQFVYPEIAPNPEQILRAKSMGHPLIHHRVRVSNDFEIDQQNFFIVTGANMAGKSTFLRTVSLSIVMANVGLPVCAEKWEYTPIRLITSMRTTDSLQKDESYFFSELKRLKYIVDEMQTRDYFIVLDEILKGTNSEDKKNGSKKFVEKLVASQSTGIIATHDLSLCELSDRIDQVKNYFFEARIENDELHFDYRIQPGICQNMNASFLLQKMGIV